MDLGDGGESCAAGLGPAGFVPAHRKEAARAYMLASVPARGRGGLLTAILPYFLTPL